VEVFDAAAQPTRREMLRLLSRGEMSAGEVASKMPALPSETAGALPPRA